MANFFSSRGSDDDDEEEQEQDDDDDDDMVKKKKIMQKKMMMKKTQASVPPSRPGLDNCGCQRRGGVPLVSCTTSATTTCATSELHCEARGHQSHVLVLRVLIQRN